MEYSSQQSINLFNGVTLTAAFSGNRKTFTTEGFSALSLDVAYDMHASETANTIDWQLEGSSDNTNWYSLSIDSTSTVSTITDRVWQMLEGNRNIVVDINYKYMRMSVRESGVATTFGTATVTATLMNE